MCDVQTYLKSMDDYIYSLRAKAISNPCEAKRKAVQSLIASGVFNKDGTPKKEIVTQSTIEVTG